MFVKYQDEHLKSPVAMITTLQFIEHFIRKAGNPFTIEFINEQYDEPLRGTTIFNNLTNDYDRNDELRRISDEWKDVVDGDGLTCKNIQIATLPSRSLPHWRSLRFECAGLALCLYPNGGIINEWYEDRSRTNGKYYSVDDVTTEEHIPLKRTKDIMYDAEIEEF